MSWIKFTDKKTGKTFDSRFPRASIREGLNLKVVPGSPAEQVGPFTNEDVYEYPNGKQNWLDDFIEWKRELKGL